MSRFRRIDIIEQPSFFFKESSHFAPPPRTFPLNPFSPPSSFFAEDDDEVVNYALDFLTPYHCLHDVDEFERISDLIQIEKTRRVKHHRVGGQLTSDLYLQSLSDRVSALELGIDKLVSDKKPPTFGERKYTWTTEIKGSGLDRKYQWKAEVKDGKKKGGPLDKSYKFTAEIKGKGENLPVKKTYQFEASSANNAGESAKKHQHPGKHVGSTRIVEIDDSYDHGALVLKQTFAKRVAKLKGKKKEMTPLDAAQLIQMKFRAYLIKRSKALRALRELAIAKNKLKELRTLFNNFPYRRHVSRDPEERQRFSEKIIVLLLTVDAIGGADVMVRAAKRLMIDELEAMLDVVDPQPYGRYLSTKRRTFDMPDGIIQKELAAGVAQVVRMLDQEASGSETLEACL